MPHGDEEPDYLESPKQDRRKYTFKRRVQEAYLFELGFTKDYQIAEYHGVTTGTISQILNLTNNPKPSTIKKFIDPIKSPKLRRRMVFTWLKQQYDIDVVATAKEFALGEEISQAVIDRIKALAAGQGSKEATRLAWEAIRKTDILRWRENLFDLLYYTYRRQSELGSAMRIANRISERARDRGDKLREATGWYYRASVLTDVPGSRWDDVESSYQEAKTLACSSDAPESPSGYYLVKPTSIDTWWLASRIRFLESGQVLANYSGEVQDHLSAVSSLLKDPNSKWHKFFLTLLRARIHLLMGDTFLASEWIEKAYFTLAESDFRARGMVEIVHAKVMRVTEPIDKVAEFLAKAIIEAHSDYDLHSARLLQFELASVECSRFPPSRPVV